MWIIDRDLLPEGPPGTNANAVGMMGPYDCDPEKAARCINKFRMYDDDGKLYYEGRASGVNFDPLDDFGAPNAGCTRIDYYNKWAKKWCTL